MQEKILTVSVAAYNVEKTLREALDSLLVPEILDKLEVFVIDDGGTDGSLEIAREYEKKYSGTFYAVHKENGGYGSTVNYSIAHATGKYLKLLDGDDWYDSGSLAELIKRLEDVDVDVVLTPYINCGQRSGKRVTVDVCETLSEGIYPFIEIKFSGEPCMHHLMFKTELLQSMNLQLTEHCFYTDTEYAYLPIPFVRTAFVWKRPLYLYRIEIAGQSVSLTGIRKHIEENKLVFWRIADSYTHMDLQNKDLVKGKLVSLAGTSISWQCLLENKRQGQTGLMNFCERLKRELPEIVQPVKRRRKMFFLIFTLPYWMYPIWNWIFIRQLIKERGGN